MAFLQPQSFDQCRSIFAADKIHAGTIDTNAMIVEFFFCQAAVLSKADCVLMLLRGNPAIGLAIALIVSIFIWSVMTGWIKVTCFKKLSEICEKHLHKGARIAVIGTLDQQKWETDEGAAQSTFQVPQTDDGTFYVESAEGKIMYHVIFEDHNESCTCADYARNIAKEPNFKCKHLYR